MATTELESKYETNSRRAERLGLLIIVGLAVEIVAAPFLGKSWLENLVTISANALIAIGVWAELYFERIARIAGDGIVAEANARAAEAQLKLAKLQNRVGTRQIEHDKFLAALSGKAKPSRVMISFSEAAGDGWWVAHQLQLLLGEAGWTAFVIPFGPDPNLRLTDFNVGLAVSQGGSSSGMIVAYPLGGSLDSPEREPFQALFHAIAQSLGAVSGTQRELPRGELRVAIFPRP